VSLQQRSKVNRSKALHALLYVVSRLPQPANIYNVLKCIWFADRDHLEQFGRQIYGERYFAPKHGPVPSLAYNMIKYAADREDTFNLSWPELLESFAANTTGISARKQPVLEELSRSELICLNAAVKKYGSLSFSRLKRISHQSRAYQEADENGDIDLEAILSELKNAKELKRHIFEDRHPGSAKVD